MRWRGRGESGAVTSAEVIAPAATNEGRYAQAFPSFGPERRGAPVIAFLRISDEFIRTRNSIYEPDIAVVIDPRLLCVIVAAGLQAHDVIVVDSRKPTEQLTSDFGYGWSIASVNATKIARETIRLPITDTAMIGAFLKVSDVVKVDSVVEELKQRFGARAEANIEAMKRGL